MRNLSDFTIKSVNRSGPKDPAQARRSKLLSRLKEQVSVLEAAKRGETYARTRTQWVTNDEGVRVQARKTRAVRPWFFEQDEGWYVQCRYGAKVLPIGDKGNAVVVAELEDVGDVLAAIQAAVTAGEFDDAIEQAIASKLPTPILRTNKGAKKG